MPNFPEIKTALDTTPLFAGKTWKIAARAWDFSPEKLAELRDIGDACLAFFKAQEKLYLAAARDNNLLRNAELHAPWAAEILDRGKPQSLVAHQRCRALAGKFPPVLRPDLLLTETGFALTELDSVPGGIGLTAFLSELYNNDNSMPELFWKAVAGNKADATVAIAVSDESSSYRPEFEWLAREIRERIGAKIFVCRAENLEVRDNAVFATNENSRERIDIVYRFFELFDLANIPQATALQAAVEAGSVAVVPPMKAFQEEKMSLALFRHPALEAFWRENLGEKFFSIFNKIVPESWIVEPTKNLPAGAILLAPKPMRDWRELAKLPKRERDLVLKASGFCEDCWGARSVSVGSDLSAEEWKSAVENAISRGEQNSLFVLQKFKKPAKLSFPVFDDNGNATTMDGRTRICPYYFVIGGKTDLGGALTTFCPADKKIIHGMSVAALAPTTIRPAK
ncbi:MAG: hypothetical protein LUD39_03885 [Opitutae bacterium]|nr:hypothetical protein [Opitutae bacterium]